MPGPRCPGLDLREAGAGGGQSGLSTQQVQLRAESGIVPLTGQLQSLLLKREVFPGDPLQPLRCAQRAVGISHFRCQADLQLLPVCQGGFAASVGGGQLMTQTAEQVQLPAAVQTQVVALCVHSCCGQSRQDRLACLGAGAPSDGGVKVAGAIVPQRA